MLFVSAVVLAQETGIKTRVAVDIDPKSDMEKRVLGYVVGALEEIPDIRLVPLAGKPRLVVRLVVLELSSQNGPQRGYAISALILHPGGRGAAHLRSHRLLTGPLENLQSECEGIATTLHASVIQLREAMAKALKIWRDEAELRKPEAAQDQLREAMAAAAKIWDDQAKLRKSEAARDQPLGQREKQ